MLLDPPIAPRRHWLLRGFCGAFATKLVIDLGTGKIILDGFKMTDVPYYLFSLLMASMKATYLHTHTTVYTKLRALDTLDSLHPRGSSLSGSVSCSVLQMTRLPLPHSMLSPDAFSLSTRPQSRISHMATCMPSADHTTLSLSDT